MVPLLRDFLPRSLTSGIITVMLIPLAKEEGMLPGRLLETP